MPNTSVPAAAGDDPAALPADHRALIVDASSQPSLLKTLLSLAAASRPALVVLACADEADALDLRRTLPAELIVAKPVLHDILRDALGSALGLAHALPAPLPLPRSADTRSRGHRLTVG